MCRSERTTGSNHPNQPTNEHTGNGIWNVCNDNKRHTCPLIPASTTPTDKRGNNLQETDGHTAATKQSKANVKGRAYIDSEPSKTAHVHSYKPHK